MHLLLSRRDNDVERTHAHSLARRAGLVRRQSSEGNGAEPEAPGTTKVRKRRQNNHRDALARAQAQAQAPKAEEEEEARRFPSGLAWGPTSSLSTVPPPLDAPFAFPHQPWCNHTCNGKCNPEAVARGLCPREDSSQVPDLLPDTAQRPFDTCLLEEWNHLSREVSRAHSEAPLLSDRSEPEGGQSPEDVRSAALAAGKAISILMKMEAEGSCQIERDSIYGAAIAVPQIARSAGWPWTLTGLAIRSYFFLVLNICLQAFLLAMIGEEQIFMYPFAGQMHLCDFGANIDQCPDGPNCKGPGGTIFSYPRLYGYDIWSTRIFIRDALKAVFPDRADEINAKVDPGEYGLENYWIRVACIFLFMIGVVSDLRKSINLMVLLWTVPTQAESWLRYEVPDWADKPEAKDLQGWSELDLVKFQIAGMPLGWKLLNGVLVLVPKLVLWLALVPSGVHYLMETAGIVDVLVNAMALTFVLDIDELLFAQLTTVATRHVMENMEELPMFDISMEEEEEDEEVLERYNKEELSRSEWKKLSIILPKRLVTVLVLQTLFMITYYVRNCERREDGSWVSKAMHLPEDLSFQPLQLMLGIEPKSVQIPFWTMPGD